MSSIAELGVFQGDNYGGLIRIRLISALDVVSIPENNGVSLALALNLKAGVSLAEMAFTGYTGEFQEPEEENENGTWYDWKINFLVPKDALSVANWLRNQRGRDLLAITTDTNGTQRLVGTKDYPIRLKADFKTGQKPSDKNGFQFQVSGKSPGRALYYLQYDRPPDPHKVFSSGFSFGFLRT